MIREREIANWSNRTDAAERVKCGKGYVRFDRADIEQSLWRRFAQQAFAYADNPAVISKNHCWSYGQLRSKAALIARAITERFFGSVGNRIALLFDHDAPMISAMLAVLKSGNCYVPLDPAYPELRLAFIADDSEAVGVVTDSSQLALAQRLYAGRDSQIINIDELNISCATDEQGREAEIEVEAQSLAYILYTSGSTGEPKGVMQSHRNVLHHICVYTNNLRIGSGDRLTVLSSYSFDAAVMDVFGALLNGAGLCVIDVRKEGQERIGEWIKEQGVSIYHSTPTLYHYFVGGLGEGEVFDTVRLVVLGGEEARWSDVEAFRRHFPAESVLINGLGPTESTVSLQYFIDGRTEVGSRGVPVGYGVEQTEVKLVDEAGEQVAVNEVGEILISSEHIALGYWRREQETRRAFVGGLDEGGRRTYITGDLGRKLIDGSIEYVGRKDFQVKVRGVRIELEEVEAAMMEEGAKEVVVIAVENQRGEKQLIGYVVREEGKAVEVREMRKRLKRRLPEWMIPTEIVEVEKMPITGSGKVDRKRLREEWPRRGWGEEESESGERSAIEGVVKGIWEEVLGVGGVGMEENFFELGGHSLLVTQVVSRIRKRLHVAIEPSALFEEPNVKGLARRVEQGRQEAALQAITRMEAVPRDGDIPLSYAQQRLWFLNQLEVNNPAYNLPTALRVSGRLNISALNRGFNEIVRRHETLRTAFTQVEEKPAQIITPALDLPIPIIDLNHLPEIEREKEALVLAAEEAVALFDLSRAPLLRVKLLRLADEDHVLLITMHHIAADGWSEGVLVKELAALYEAYGEGKPSPLPDLPIQYADYAVLQRRWLQGESLERQLAFWKKQLQGAPQVLELLTDRPRPKVMTSKGGTESFKVRRDVVSGLKRLSQQQGATIFMTLLAAYGVLLYRYSGQEDVLIGTPIANRNREEIEDMIGFFVNTLVMRIDLSGDVSFTDVVKRVKEMSLEAYIHQDLPFEKLVEEMRPERGTSYSPLIQVMLVLQTATMSSMKLPGLTLNPIELYNGTTMFDLLLNLLETGEGIEGEIVYSRDLFDGSTIRRFATHFQRLLEAIVADPDRPIGALPLLNEAEQHQILVDWNYTRVDAAENLCIHTLFEAQAERTPDAIAVMFEDEQLSYRELNGRANQLAHFLQAKGVMPETRVGICVERSIEMVVGVLGILKAGGAYVPLDPSYPKDRLSFMMEDARSLVLLTQQRLVDTVPAHGTFVLCLDVEWSTVADQGRENLSVAYSTDSLAYILYTSGSTGRPKGVAMSHGSLYNLISWQLENSMAALGSKTLQFASLSFDVSFQEMFSTWCSGGTLILLREDLRRDPESLLYLLAERDLERLYLPFIALQHLADVAERRELVLSGLREVITAGEQLQITKKVAALFNRLNGCALHNHYGPTESHVVTAFSLTGATGDWPNLPPIGVPIKNTQIHILDRYLQPVPVGALGELYIGGVGLARGYFNKPHLTAEKFIPNPFSADPGARLYKTGDTARYLPDGVIQFLGRIDQQVKIRGFRIELGEVEAVLGAYHKLREAIVVVREDVPGEKRLVAYITADPQAVKIDEMQAYLKQRLPRYMIPSAFVVLDKLPLTPSNKINRSALPIPDSNSLSPHRPYIGPGDEVERRLIQIWEQVLGVRPIAVVDDFFDLGGHSMLAVALIAQIRRQFARDLPLSILYNGATVRDMANGLRQSAKPQVWSPLVKIQTEGSKPPFFCVHPIGGDVLCYSSLSNHLGQDQPFYALQALKPENVPEDCNTIEYMASRYIEAVFSARPEGPYLLGGYSFGGLIAYEMARQMHGQGLDVALLVLVDTRMPDASEARLDETGLLAMLARNKAEQQGKQLQLSPEDIDRLHPDERLSYIVDQMKQAGLLPQEAGLGPVKYYLRGYKFRLQAEEKYWPKPYPGKITFLRVIEEGSDHCKNIDKNSPDLRLGWDELSSQPLDIQFVTGTHSTILNEPHVKLLAKRISTCISKIEAMQLTG